MTSATYSSGVVALGYDVRPEERGLLGELPGHGEAPRLVADGQAVAALDLDGGGALPAHLGDQVAHVAGELLVGGGPGGGDGGADATGGVRRPGHPGGELRGAVAGEDQVASGSRRTRGAPHGRRRRRGRRRAGRRRPARSRRPSAALEDERGVGDRCRAGPAPAGVVGDQLADVVMTVAVTPAPRSGRSPWPGRGRAARVALAEHDAAVGHDLDDVLGGRREDGGVLVGAGARRTHVVGVERDQVGPVADGDPAGVLPAERVVTGWPAARRSAAVQWPRCWVARRSSSSTARISSKRSITAWLSEPRVRRAPASWSRRLGPIPSPRSRSVVGQKPTKDRGPPISAMSSLGEVRGVDQRCCARPRWPARRQTCVGVTPYAARHSSFSATCSERWTWSGRRRRVGASSGPRHGADGVDRRRPPGCPRAGEGRRDARSTPPRRRR